MSGKPRLTVAIIARNAESLLPLTLDSIQYLADETILVDTGSTDGTKRVAAGYPVRVFDTVWQDSFSGARNTCLAQAKGDWILWLDAGEHVSPEAAQQLRGFVDRDADVRTAYLMVVRSAPSAPGLAPEQIACIRLVPNHPQIRFAGRVAELVSPSLSKLGYQLGALPYRIQRAAADNDLMVRRRKAQRNILLADLELRERGPSARLLNCLGEAFQTLNDPQRAFEFHQHAIASSAAGSLEQLEGYYGALASLNQVSQNLDRQVNLCLSALDIFPRDTQLLCAMGSYMQAKGQMSLGLRSYETAYRFGRINPQTWHLSDIREAAAASYALAVNLTGDTARAESILHEAASEVTYSERLQRQLLYLAVDRADRSLALSRLDDLRTDSDVETMKNVVRGSCLAAEQNWSGARNYLQDAYDAGCRDLLLMQWFTETLLGSGEFKQAQKVVGEWNTLDPANPVIPKYSQQLNRQQMSSAQRRVDLPSGLLSPHASPQTGAASPPKQF